MHKRFIRIDIEYDMDINPLRLHSFVILDNLKRILEEDMPYAKVIFTRDSPDIKGLDKRVRAIPNSPENEMDQ